MVDACGLIATILVFLSFVPKDILFIRTVNLAGSIFFVFYGFGVGAFWTGFMNAGLIGVQLFHIIKIKKGAKHDT